MTQNGVKVSSTVRLVMWASNAAGRTVVRRCSAVAVAVVLSSGLASVSNAALAPGSSEPLCVGDCDNSGAVTVDELIKGVGIALGTLPLDQCAQFDCNGTAQVT